MLLIIAIIIFLAFAIPVSYNFIKYTQKKRYDIHREVGIKEQNRKRIRRIVILIISLVFLLCLLFYGNYLITKNINQDIRQEKFDKIKWATREGRHYPYRNNMLNDLITNQKLKGIKKDEVLFMLGQPTRTDSNYLFYTVDQKFIGEIPVPLYTKSLVIKFANDTVEWRKIKE